MVVTRFQFDGTTFVVGTENADTLTGFIDDEVFVGDAGDDVIIGAGGTDTVLGGEGSDTILFDGASLLVGGPDQLDDFSIADDRIEITSADFGVAGSISFINALAADLPSSGVNFIVLQDSDDDSDTLTDFNARSAARLIGDQITTDGAGFFVYFNSVLGVNRLVFSENLADGEASLVVLAAFNSSTGNDAIAALSTFSVDNFVFNETQLGSENNDVLESQGGNDLQNGFTGDDSLLGNDGNDTQLGRPGDDFLRGGEGDDTQRGGEGDDTLAGNGGDDFQVGGDDNDHINGQNGDDIQSGGKGNDFVSGDANNDEQNGNAGDDTLLGGTGDDTQEGGIGNDLIVGGSGNDVITDRNGDDTLDGGAGTDTLTGGAGEDVFAFTDDPFNREDVSAAGRQVVLEQDDVTDFNFDDDVLVFDTSSNGFDIVGQGQGNAPLFQSLDATEPGAMIESGVSIIVLENTDDDSDANTPFNAAVAADQIAGLTDEDGAGFFIYHNSALEQNRLVFSSNLNSVEADLNILAVFSNNVGQDAVDALQDFDADSFGFSPFGDISTFLTAIDVDTLTI